MKEIMYSNSYREQKAILKKEKEKKEFNRKAPDPDTLIVHQGGMKEDSYHNSRHSKSGN